jgi:hypothetical protein
MRRKFAFVLLLLAFCKGPEYDVEIKNSTEHLIYQAHVQLNDFESIGGTVGPHVSKVHMAVHHRLPAVAHVVWNSDTNEHHDVAVPLKVPPRFIGSIVFEIHSGGTVTVSLKAE